MREPPLAFERLGRHRPIVAATCAACLVLSIAACGGRAPKGTADTRPSSIEAISPRGAAHWPFAFEWKTTAPATAVCRVTVFDLAERQLLQFETKGSRLAAPEDLRKLLAVTRRFLWRVAVEDANGADAAQSQMTEFEVQ
jgi:hypothetical protein